MRSVPDKKTLSLVGVECS